MRASKSFVWVCVLSGFCLVAGVGCKRDPEVLDGRGQKSMAFPQWIFGIWNTVGMGYGTRKAMQSPIQVGQCGIMKMVPKLGPRPWKGASPGSGSRMGGKTALQNGANPMASPDASLWLCCPVCLTQEQAVDGGRGRLGVGKCLDPLVVCSPARAKFVRVWE